MNGRKINMRPISKKQAAINRKLHKTYELMDENPKVCSGCGRTDRPLSHSHIISRKRCHSIGKPHLIYDKNNLVFDCFGSSDSCHEIWEHKSVEEQKKLLNWEQRLAFIKEHDIVQYNTIMLC